MAWTAVAVAIRKPDLHKAIEKEIELLRRLEVLVADEVLIIEDACEEAGSAGSALNGLLVITEQLCAKKGLSVLSEEVLCDASVLILLLGEPTDSAPFGHAFEPLTAPEHWTEFPDTSIVKMLNILKTMKAPEHKGVWICGTDSCFTLNKVDDLLPLDQSKITVFSFKSNEAKGHGTYEMDPTSRRLRKIHYDSNICGPIVLALLYFPPAIAASFLDLYQIAPISAATYIGQDTGCFGLKLSLFFDILASSTSSETEFVKNEIGERKVDRRHELRQRARAVIWKKLHNTETEIVLMDAQDYVHLDHNTKENQVSPQLMREVWVQNILNLLADYASHHPIPITHFPLLLALDEIYGESVISKTLTTLEQVAINNQESSARILSLTSDFLYLAARGKGGLRSGPAANRNFQKAFDLIADISIEERNKGIRELFTELRSNWLNGASRLVRAARHCEAAAHILSGNEITKLSSNLFKFEKTGFSGKCTSYAAARVDIFGGWLDTPPITFMVEPSAVINMAIKIDNEFPLSCSVVGIEEPSVLVCLSNVTVRFHRSDQIFRSHRDPSAEGSLICACLIALKVLKDPSDDLAQNLTELYGFCGLRVTCHSRLPHGSGLGTSSILAAVILNSLTFGQLSRDDLIATVLHVEHLLTTGGGWQDQVGGIQPGIKLGKMIKEGSNNFKISTTPIPIPSKFEAEVNRRLVLIYTGKTRLAKNLLQDVVRNFYAGGEVVAVLREMQNRIDNVAKSISGGKFPFKDIQLYYEVKKKLAAGCEPPAVASLIQKLKEHELSEIEWLAGAGGGGFLYVWLREGITIGDVKKVISSNMSVHSIEICHDPLVLQYD